MSDKTIFKLYNRYLVFLFSLALILIICTAQYYSGPEVVFSLFYIFPIMLATWKTGIWAGIFLSFSSAFLMLYIEKFLLNLFPNTITPFLNNIFRLIIFLIITYIVSELKISLEKQKELARIDPLTSIANNRAFYEAANMEFEKAKRHEFPISVLYMDLDNFKEVNDRLGHSTGDHLLKMVARTIIKNIRAIDTVARLGGDEFGILLTQTGADSAYVVAGKIKEMIMLIMKKNNWPVTTSIGVVSYLKAPESVDEMIKKADFLMYSAKSSGKNTIKQTVVS